MTTSPYTPDEPARLNRHGAVHTTHIVLLVIGIAMGYVAFADQSPSAGTFAPAIEIPNLNQSEDWHGNVRRSH